MKRKLDKKRLKEIQKVYRSLGIESKNIRKYLTKLGTLPDQSEQKEPTIFIEAGITSCNYNRQ
jgi:hypothetical protein